MCISVCISGPEFAARVVEKTSSFDLGKCWYELIVEGHSWSPSSFLETHFSEYNHTFKPAKFLKVWSNGPWFTSAFLQVYTGVSLLKSTGFHFTLNVCTWCLCMGIDPFSIYTHVVYRLQYLDRTVWDKDGVATTSLVCLLLSIC